MNKPKIAFTANAFVHALQIYGENLFFKLVPIYGNLFVNENALCGQEYIIQASISDKWLAPLIDHWFEITNPPPFGETDEITILAKLDTLYPDNIIIVVDKLREFSRLNRVYSNDELYSVEQLYSLMINKV